MNRLFASARLRLLGVLACVAGALCLLLYGVAGDRLTTGINRIYGEA